jgi:hypothetical protein
MRFSQPLNAGLARLAFLIFGSALLLAAGEVPEFQNAVAAQQAEAAALPPMTPVPAMMLAAPQITGAATPLPATLSTDVPVLNSPFAAGEPAAEPADTKAQRAPEATRPASLARLVADMRGNDEIAAGDEREFGCLATAVYFESRGEPLEGQLAVAQVILNRVESGRYAGSVCAVLRQPGQFSFDVSRRPADNADWKTAQAIAAIAMTGGWREVAPDALAFHAARLSPGWRMTKVAQIGNHVFYR